MAEGIQEASGYIEEDQWIDWVGINLELDILATRPLNDYQTYKVVRLLDAPQN
jgi:hypothetical protein